MNINYYDFFETPRVSIELFPTEEADIEMLHYITRKLTIDATAAIDDENFVLAKSIIEMKKEIKDGLTAANNQTADTTTKDSTEGSIT